MRKLLFTMLIICLVMSIKAQDFEVSPVDLRFTCLPENMQTRQITITNHSNKRTIYKISLEDYVINEDGNKIKVSKQANKNSCSGWLSISPNTMEIDPNSQAIVNVSINVPANRRESRWCRLIIQESKEQTSFAVDGQSRQAGLNVVASIVVDVIQTPQDFQDYNVYLTNFVETESEKGNVRNLTATLENHGNAIVKGKLYVLASNMDTMKEYELFKQDITIFSQSNRVAKFELKEGMLESGTYDFSVILDMGLKAPLAGARMKERIIIK